MRTSFAVAVFITVTLLVGPLAAQDKKQKEKPPATSKSILADLQTPVEFPNNQAIPFSGLLRELAEELKQRGKEITIIVDEEAYREESPDAPPVLDQQITFRQLPEKSGAGVVLRQALKQLPTKSAFVIRAGKVVILPEARTEKKYLYNQTFFADFNDRPLTQALDELSELTGISIVVDGRAKEKLQLPVTARFRDDVAVQDAVRMLADMADLKPVYLVTGLYITTPARAKEMEKELKEIYEPKAAPAGRSGFPFGGGGFGPGGGGRGPGGGAPGGAPQPPPGMIEAEPQQSPLAPPLPPAKGRIKEAA